MFREIVRVSQVQGEPQRRWFEDDGLDLMVWSAADGEIVGIQLCYDKGTDSQRALTWHQDSELSHMRVDDGEDRPGRYKSTPVLVPDGALDAERILRLFEPASRSLEPAVAQAVRDVIARFARNRT